MEAIAYYRVSTKRQGDSGLGLEAQQQRVEAFAAQHGITILDAFVDVASGALQAHERPVLQAAMDKAKACKAIILIAKLDRLSRRVSMIASLMDEGVRFVCTDLGLDTDPFMLHIYAAVAEKERKAIGERTSAALQALKARGVKLGTKGRDNIQGHNRKLHSKALEHARQLAPILRELIAQRMSLNKIAIELTRQQIKSATGGAWGASSVRNVLKRLETKPYRAVVKTANKGLAGRL